MAGIAMPLGALAAWGEKIRSQWLEQEFRHAVIAFGGGALLSAVALVLVPEGSRQLNIASVTVLFLAGGLTFMGLDILLDKFRSPAGQLVAMMSDFLPEALALGAAFATDGSAGLLLAALIAIQNLPEGFNSFGELRKSGSFSAIQIVLAFFLLAWLGPVAGLIGFFWLAQFPVIVAGVMIFAAGGILYLVFQDIAPQAVLKNRWAPAMGSVLGFLLGLVGQMLVG